MQAGPPSRMRIWRCGAADRPIPNGAQDVHVDAIMSRPVVTVAPSTTLREAATLMRRNDIGALPVVEHARPVGVVTDRDMVVAALAFSGNAGARPVVDAMSQGAVRCTRTHTIAQAAALMGDAQVERLLIVDGEDRLVGMLSVGDIAVNASEVLAGQAIGEICEDRSTRGPGHRIRPVE